MGEALTDIVIPRAGAPTEHVGGSPANVARALGRLDLEVLLSTRLARDSRGRRIVQAMRDDGVVLTPGSFAAERTSTAVARLDSSGQPVYEFDIDWKPENGLEPPTDAHVHVGSIGAILPFGCEAIPRLVRARELGCTVSYDPNIRPALMGSPEYARETAEWLISKCSVVKASTEDLAWLYPHVSTADVLDRWQALGVPLAVITDGSHGYTAASAGQGRETFAAYPTQDVADTVGAGDTFMAGLISGLCDAGLLGNPEAVRRLPTARWSQIEPSLRYAAAAAAINCTRPGAQPPTRDEVSRMLGATANSGNADNPAGSVSV
ncbi:PfkB family carbohydrate kinase [Brooklawnia cerclae]|uniref:Fructokinase n=1 Tax=Brooklawnia cerclae TaxID=349934 RepID=A0ABX0SGH3_9ACTN|nr:fructokinase [Brooklawnia cerclae]